MDGVFILIVGIALGILLMWLYVSMQTYWKKNKDARASSIKARKEMQEKSMKARLDAQSARSALIEAGLRVLFLVIAIVITSWVIWTIVMI
jgi:hypothetical protein